MSEVVCLGQAVVDCITRNPVIDPEKKHVYIAERIGLSIGGDAVNEASVLARLGHRVRLVCAAGDDLAGRLILSEMEKLGVDTRSVDIDREGNRPTPIANLMVNQDGSRYSYNSLATKLGDYIPDEEAVRQAAREGARILSLASLFRAPVDRADTIRTLVRAAKEEGMLVCADTKIPTFRKLSLAEISDVLPMIDYIFPNDNEAGYFTGETEPEKMAEAFARMGVKNVIVKMGERGCFVRGEQEMFHLAALNVKATDSTGAGDSFVGGFISGLLRGFSLSECCRYGTTCAAACVQEPGAGGGIRSGKEADLLFAGQTFEETAFEETEL